MKITNQNKEQFIKEHINKLIENMTTEDLKKFFQEKTFNKLYVLPIDVLQKELNLCKIEKMSKLRDILEEIV